MEGERKRSKGSFFHLFDWNGKSRKKLFLNNSELPVAILVIRKAELAQGQENVESIARSQHHALEVDDRRVNSSNKASSDFSCTSSVTSDEGYGSRAPGVVARLMGLDSLPTSNAAESSSTPLLNASSLRVSQYDRSTPNLWSEYKPMEYLNISSNLEGYSRNSLESRSQKVQNRPIERFQTEMLPPKSAKSIALTHHKLLSPIKNPGFIPTKNATYIMEAAAKIIEASPKATVNGKMPSIGSTSVPLRIRDLKRKMEAAHTASRPQRSNDFFAAKNTKGQLCDRSARGSEGISSCKISTFSEKDTSESVRNKGKLVSPSVQVRSNVQRREGVTSRNSNIKKQKEQKEIRSNQSPKSQSSSQKTKKTSENRTTNVLRQNNQKQNSSSGKESTNLKNSFSNQAGKRVQTMSSSVGQSRTTNKVVLKPETSRKMHLVVTDTEKEKPNNISLKKRPVNGEPQIGRGVSDNESLNRVERSIKCNLAVDGCMNTAVDNRKNGMDVVSFTFTSPVKKATPDPQPSVMEKSKSSVIDLFGSNGHPYFNKSTSFPGLNIIGGDALGVLLEQKLRELANKVESSQSNTNRDEKCASSTSILQNSMSICHVISTIPAAQDRRSQLIENDKSDYLDEFDCFTVEDSRLNENLKWQGSKEIEEYSSSSNFSEAEKDRCQHLSPVSILEPSFGSGSCSNTNVESDDVLNGFFTNESLEVEGETELSDSASSISTVEVGRKHIAKMFTKPQFKESSEWELDYVRDVLDNAELMLKEFRLDIPRVINPLLFHQLEDQENGRKINEEMSKLERKVLFDCVSECIELMCGQTFVGSYKSWAKTGTLFQRKGWLAEELYKEILGWKCMGSLMVDELVDKDMSSGYGRWLNFNIEAFEQGIEIEKDILTCLVDELVSDLFIL
ncbi:uncharacterized protein LOC8269803 isoform X2 [Ricinus communis]|nr:uncharacterized protein LOC8269803 isoform X2 [Ricinus communis]XP_015570537.1 uncharacterized protein LOC8269803 isoform X2 [Ricinus communis]XP_048235932.1 uncharacterized protein LOC8269803 isoform X2 [Ricinus communis]|eukprot:XP_015570536.1 uncharacterized protein LOC8269803 isoform X2 [Ricinus communis]